MVQREQLPEDQRRFYDAVKAIRRRPISGPFITLLNSSPDLTARYAHLGHYFHARGQADESILSLRVRTLTAMILSRALSRIPLVTKHEDMPAERQHFFDRIVRTRGRVAEPFQVLLNSPEVADRLANVGAFLLYDTILPPAVKTLTWLIAAREYDCDV